jgi:diguanylate cyclase (GGDEF)-like protein
VTVAVGVVAEAVRSGRITTSGEDGVPSSEGSSTRGLGAVAVPLVVGARVTGAIELSSPTPAVIHEGRLEVLQTLATHAAAAIEAACLHGETEELAQTDGLTELGNRRRLDLDLMAECGRCSRYGHPLALIMLDVDHFKRVNDSFGHVRGDEVLKELAETVRSGIRVTDSAYRYGGEEFAVLAPETDAQHALMLAERLRRRIEDRFADRGSPVPITASLGVGLSPPERCVPESLIATADAALYRAKADGRNRVRGSAPVA